ncbi:DNA polymerase [Balamuthia mandrillaris]
MDKWITKTKRPRPEGTSAEQQADKSSKTTSSASSTVSDSNNKHPKRTQPTGSATHSSSTSTSVFANKKRKKKATRTTAEITLGEKHVNVNENLTKFFIELSQLEKSKGQIHRSLAYAKAAKALANHPKPITSGKEAQELEGIGAKIAKKIDEILASGKLSKLEAYNADPTLQALHLVQSVSGIGPAAARKLVTEHGVRTLEDLENMKDHLNHHQKIGLKYYHEFNERIPRKEMECLERIVLNTMAEVDSKLIGTTCGSYRRGAATSGDISLSSYFLCYLKTKYISFFNFHEHIDVLITHPAYTNATKNQSAHQYLPRIVNALRAKGFLTDDLSNGKVKYMGVCKLQDKRVVEGESDKQRTKLTAKEEEAEEEEKEEEKEKDDAKEKETKDKGKEKQIPEAKEKSKVEAEQTISKPYRHRRIDLRIVPYENYYCGLLYFTGSDFFNQQMRTICLERGFSLNEYAIFPVGETGEKGEPIEVHSEKDIFDIIGMEFKTPAQRNL